MGSNGFCISCENKGGKIKSDNVPGVICIKCLSDGWSICKYTNELFNKNNVRSDDFNLVYELGFSQSHEEAKWFNSNKSYNLYHIENEIQSLNNAMLLEKNLEIYIKIKLASEEKRAKFVNERIDYLNKLKKQFNV